MSDETHFKLIDTYFRENTLVDHHLSSCNDFYEKGIFKVFTDMNPIQYYSVFNESTKQHKYNAQIYIGGRDGKMVYYGKPTIFDDKNQHYMFPNEARLRNMTYGISIHYDVEIVLTIIDNDEEVQIVKQLPGNGHFFLGMFPIMLQSNLCILKNMPKETRYAMGECNHDYGGYFIIDGKEKVIVPQEKFSNNMIYIRTVNDNLHDFSVEIRSVSEDASKPQRTFAIRRVQEEAHISNGQIMVFIPNVRKSIPLFIVMRALGIVSDKDICKMIVHDIDKYEHYIRTLIPCVHDAGGIFNQMNALEYIASFTKVKTIQESYNILINYLLPHIGEMNFKAKAYFIGHMVFELLKVIHKDEKVTDRDSYKYKRVDSTGYLMKQLFIEHANIMYESIYKKIDKEFYYHSADFIDKEPIIGENSLYLNLFTEEHFMERIIEGGFKKGFKGAWGSQAHTKIDGVLQAVNRLSYFTFINHLRKVNLALDSSSKLVGPHMLHGSQWGVIDPIDTPDGHSIGLDKHMATMCKISDHISVYDIVKWVMTNMDDIIILENCSHTQIDEYTKLFINGVWIGIVKEPIQFTKKFVSARRSGLFPSTISVSFQAKSNIIYIYGDEGRLLRPILFYENGRISYEGREDNINSFWENYFKGWLELKDEYNPVSVLKGMDERTIYLKQGIMDYLDSSETETAYIAVLHKDKYEGHTHLEIHPSLMLGVLGNQICFPQHNPLPRNVFSCSQSRQAVSFYHSNYLNRIDKMGVILNYGQKPLLRTRYLNYLNEEQHPYGENAIVAIMCHTGYNVEDSILINEASVRRGMFKTTYYNMYETIEETASTKSTSEKRIRNIYNEPLIKKTRPGFNYNELDERGIIKENTMMDDKTVVIGKITYSKESPDDVSDESICPKKGQIGYVDKTYITDNDEGRRIAKVRIREDREPSIGDKFASRCGQKGTVGILIPEENMPFTKDGIKPDMIINPHALPSRMTLGQLIECTFSKLGCSKGCSIDSTAFLNKGPKHKEIGKLLNEYGYNSSGNELLYNGITGEQIESDIFMGPTYYMRLKHMVKDKINYRAAGPRTLLTRQTNHGRANDGGLRIGEMERDGVIGHGMSFFLQDAMMKRGDEYKVAVCNQSGSIAIYNKDMDTFYSPNVDGPIQYDITNEIVPKVITKYGKEFSIVEIPYCFKLLMHELTSMNVHMRLITAENIDQLTVTGNKNLSDILKNVNNNLESDTPKENKNSIANKEKLSILETEMKRAEMKYESRLKGLKQKYRHLNGKVPVHSYDNRELKQLEENKIGSRYEYYKFKQEIYIEQLLSTIDDMKQLQVDYAELKQSGNNEEIKKTQLKYNDLLKIYKDITGSEYSAAIGVYLAGLPKNQTTLSAIAEEKTVNGGQNNSGQNNSGQINSGQTNSGQSNEESKYTKVIKTNPKDEGANIASKMVLNELSENEANETNETSASNETNETSEAGANSGANSGANETKKVNFSV